jgi:hypothetical protein
MSVGYVPNRWLAGDAASLFRARALILAAYAALAHAERHSRVAARR